MTRLVLFRGTMLTKALGPGERWITVHPHGPGEKGQPVLIQEQTDGSAKVIGGAGGKLNHLRLTGVKARGSYGETLQRRAEERKAAAKRQKERDKALGIQQSKAEAQQKVVEAKRAAQREYVKGVAEIMGWSKEDLHFDEDKTKGLSEHVANKLRERHLSDLVKRARQAVDLNRERLLTDHAARAEAQLGEIPLHAQDPDTVSVADVDPVSVTPSGLGFSPGYGARAEAAGADVPEEAKAFKKGTTEGQRKAAEQASATAEAVKKALEELRDPETDAGKLLPQLVDAKQALDLLKLEKKRRLAEKKAVEARKEIAAADKVPEKAYVIEVEDSASVDDKVAAEIAADLRTVGTRAFLAEVAKHTPDPMRDLAQHVGVGAYNSINALSLAAGGTAMVDRSVVDVLGIGGASRVLARRLQADLSPEEFHEIAEGMEEFHLQHYAATSEEAIARAKELAERAAEIQLGEAENGNDLAALQEINQRKATALSEANKTLGVALGEMEANAALVYALGRAGDDKPFETVMGPISVESAVRQARAIGLQRGDFTIETAGGQRILKVTPEGLDRLANPVNREDLQQVRRNLDIIGGRHDEEGWMPEGIVDRADLGAKPGAAAQLAEPFEPGADLEGSVKAYIGGRTADGDTPGDIVADLQSLPFLQRVGDRGAEYRAIIDRLAPLAGDDGRMRQAESLREGFEGLADEFVQGRYGQERSALHKQAFDAENHGVEALHRALAAHPSGVAAYKPVGELTPQDQAALREVFAKQVAKESAATTSLRHDLERHEADEPEKHIEDMFGDQAVNPDWTAWAEHRAGLREKLGATTTTWPKYVETMRSPERAYAAMQDIVKSDVNKAFADSYNVLNPKAPLKLGRAAIRDNLNHLDAVDPEARAAREAKEAGLRDGLRNRTQGRYAGGAVSDKLDAAREDEAGLAAAQMGLFGAEPAPEAAATPLGADERHYLGHVAERQIAALMPKVGANFRPGQPVKLFRPTMSGGKNWARQRAIKHIDANKRSVLSFGTGAGKTLIGLGAFTHLHSQGKVKRGLFLAPSISQEGFQGEAIRFLDPKKGYRWHAKPGASRDERIAAYKDPGNHFAVMTHQAFRDDMLHLGAQHAGIEPQAMAEKLAGMSREDRRDWMRGVMQREGIDFDYLNLDEGHETLNREGKENSALANVIDALSDHVPYYVNASADPVKNDVSEAFSLLQKMDPGRYPDAARAAFMRRYGVNSQAAKDGLRRELARFQYPSKIDPDVTATRSEVKVGLSAAQKASLREVEGHVSKARLARMQGKVDVEALKQLSPSSFEGVPDDQHEAVARELSRNLGLIKQAGVRKVLEAHDQGEDLEAVARIAGERKGKPGIIFAHSLAAVDAIKRRLGNEYRVATITGKDSAKDKGKRIAEFNPQAGDRQTDIIVASDAGAVGANLQSGRWLVNFDTPDTAKTHAQRNGRINRVGQQHDVELMDLVRDHPEEARRRDRLKRKYGLRDDLTSPMEGLDDTGLAGFLRRRSVARENGGLL